MYTPDLRLFRFSGVVVAEPLPKRAATQARERLARCHRRIDALVGFAALGSSRYLVVAADSATAAIFAGGALDLAPAASGRYVALAGMTSKL